MKFKKIFNTILLPASLLFILTGCSEVVETVDNMKKTVTYVTEASDFAVDLNTNVGELRTMLEEPNLQLNEQTISEIKLLLEDTIEEYNEFKNTTPPENLLDFHNGVIENADIFVTLAEETLAIYDNGGEITEEQKEQIKSTIEQGADELKDILTEVSDLAVEYLNQNQ